MVGEYRLIHYESEQTQATPKNDSGENERQIEKKLGMEHEKTMEGMLRKGTGMNALSER